MSYGWPIKSEFVIPKKTKKSIGFNVHRNRNTVTSEMKAWLRCNIRNHWFLAEKIEDQRFVYERTLWIHFINSQDAMLFHLTWGGQ